MSPVATVETGQGSLSQHPQYIYRHLYYRTNVGFLSLPTILSFIKQYLLQMQQRKLLYKSKFHS